MNSKIEKQNPKIFPPWPCFGDDEIKAVERVLRSGDVNQWTGPEVTNRKGSFKFLVLNENDLQIKLMRREWSGFMNIIHLGSEQTVTGSCHLLQTNGINIMVECGLAQGNDVILPMGSWPVRLI